jgi:hypothetical protein
LLEDSFNVRITRSNLFPSASIDPVFLFGVAGLQVGTRRLCVSVCLVVVHRLRARLDDDSVVANVSDGNRTLARALRKRGHGLLQRGKRSLVVAVAEFFLALPAVVARAVGILGKASLWVSSFCQQREEMRRVVEVPVHWLAWAAPVADDRLALVLCAPEHDGLVVVLTLGLAGGAALDDDKRNAASLAVAVNSTKHCLLVVAVNHVLFPDSWHLVVRIHSVSATGKFTLGALLLLVLFLDERTVCHLRDLGVRLGLLRWDGAADAEAGLAAGIVSRTPDKGRLAIERLCGITLGHVLLLFLKDFVKLGIIVFKRLFVVHKSTVHFLLFIFSQQR